MEFTGERYVPNLDWPELSYEHWHRYLYASEFVAGKIVLDVSAGEGYGGFLLAGTASRVVGVDADPETVRHASASYQKPNLEFRCGLAEAIPVVGQHIFDVVTSFETLEHLGADQQTSFGREIKRLLKPQGIALISTPNRRHYTDESQNTNPFHHRELYEDEFIDFLSGFFRSVHVLGQRVYPVSYMWPLRSPGHSLLEHQLEFSDGRFSPVNGDQRKPLYMIAFCTDAEHRMPSGGVLLDTSERAIAQRLHQLSEAEQAVQLLSSGIAESKIAVRELEAQLQERAAEAQRAAEEVVQRDTEFGELRAQLQAAQVEHARAAQERETLQQAIDEQRELQRGLWELAREKDTIFREIAELRLQGAAIERAELERRVRTLAEEREAAEREAAELRRTLGERATELAALEQRVEQEARLRDAQEVRAEHQVAELRRVAEERTELERRVGALTKAKVAAESEAAELRRAVEDRLEQNAVLTSQLQLMTSHGDDLRELVLEAHDQLLRSDGSVLGADGGVGNR